ncbi:MAG: hypothetical protein B7Y39_04645 [Bdellovibrio sp. 28-41-41]|nr:MAG: hypothetical protein B7Y39_04645 [Bdellovibrio sp. 28-41-41]
MYVFIINLFLILWALHQFGKNKSETQLRMQQLIKPGKELAAFFWPSVIAGFASMSWRQEFVNQSRLWRSQVWDFRRFLFGSSQSLLSFFWLFVCFALFLEFGSYIVLGISFATMASSYLPKVRDIAAVQASRSLIYFALTLFFLELGFKNSGLMMQYLLDSQIVFWITIDSVTNLLLILVVATILGFLIPVQGWSFVVSFLLYLNSQLSFLCLVFMVIGELLGTTLYLIMHVRGWDSYYQKKLGRLLKWIAGYLVSFAVLVYIGRQFVSFGSAYNQLDVLKWIYLGTVFLLLAGLYVTVMIWGHFAAAKQDKEVVVSDAGLIGDLERTIDDPVSLFIVSQMRARLEKLLGYRSDLQTDPDSKKKIPPFVLKQFEAEIKIIERLKS